MSESSKVGSEEGTPTPLGHEPHLLDLLVVFAKNKRLVFGLPLGAAIVSAIISLALTPTYTGRTTILPPQQRESSAAALLARVGGLSDVLGSSLGIKHPNDLYVGMLQSETIANRLIHRFELLKVYDTEYLVDTRNFLKGVSRITSGKDGVIAIEVEDRDPKRAAALANAYVEELERLAQTLAVTEASKRRLFLEKQLKSAKDTLGQAETELRKTQEKTGLIKLDEQGRAIIEAVATLRAQIASKEIQLRVMRSFATEHNPDLFRTEQELAGMRSQLAGLERASQAGAGDIFVPTRKVPEFGLEYVRRLRDVKYYETMFELLAKQYELAKIDEAKESVLIQVLDKATEPEKRTKPKRTQIVLITAFVAGILTILFVLLRESSERGKADPFQRARMDLIRRYLWSK